MLSLFLHVGVKIATFAEKYEKPALACNVFFLQYVHNFRTYEVT